MTYFSNRPASGHSFVKMCTKLCCWTNFQSLNP